VSAVALAKAAELLGDDAWELGNPDVVNAVLVYQMPDGSVQYVMRHFDGSRSGFGRAVMRTGAQLIDSPEGLN